VTLYLPGFIDAVRQQQSHKLANIECLFSRGAILENEEQFSPYKNIAKQLGMSLNNEQFPHAAIKHATEKNSDDHRWMTFASPILLLPNREHLAMVKANHFSLTEVEAESFCHELNLHFEEDELHFTYQTAEQWYCTAEKPFETAKISPETIIGENIYPHIPHGENKMSWQAVFNEVQMLLHHSPTNKKRIDAGKPEINSLWFWGAGQLPDNYQAQITSVITDDICVKSMAKLGSVLASPYNKQFSSNIKSNAQNIIYLSNDFFSLMDLSKIDETLFLQLRNFLKSKIIDELVFYFSEEKKLVVTAKNIKRFWKRNRKFNTLF